MDSLWIWLGVFSLVLILVLIYLRALGVVSVRSVTWKVTNSVAMKTKEAYICVLILLIIGVAYYCHNYFIRQPTGNKIYTNDRSHMEYDRIRMRNNRDKGFMGEKMQNDIQQAYRHEILKENERHSNMKDNNQLNRKFEGSGFQVVKPIFAKNDDQMEDRADKTNGKVDNKADKNNGEMRDKADKTNGKMEDKADLIDESEEEYDDPEIDIGKQQAGPNDKMSAKLQDKAKELADELTANKALKPGSDVNLKDYMKNLTKASSLDQPKPKSGDTVQGTFQKTCPKLPPIQKFDCHPEVGATEQLCSKRGCCWEKDPARLKLLTPKDEKSKQAPVDVPYCFYPLDHPGYMVTDSEVTPVGFNYRLTKNTLSHYPGDVKYLLMEVIFQTENILRVKITDANNKRYEVPLDVPQVQKKASNTLYSVAVSEKGSPFSLTVTRASTRTAVFSTKGMAPLMFSDQFLQLSSSLPSSYIFGIGERRGDLLMSTDWTRHTIWTRDQGPREETNLYGAHPFYQVMEGDGNSNGFFLMNSNAMDVVLQPLPAITWKTIGGVLDFFIFMGPTPQDVTRQLTSIVGRPFMPPYWSLGFHICRWGYKDVKETLEVVEGMRKAGIPQDVQWNDIDYMDNKKDFTTDENKFGNQAELVGKVHNYGMKYIVIVDPGIPVNVTKGKYKPLDLGLDLDIFLKNDFGQHLIGKVWPGKTVFPDFTHPKSHLYWSTLVSDFIDKVPVDGLWIDMNEISNFGNGSVDGCPQTKYDNPPYTPDVYEGSLYAKTICPSGKSHLSRVYDDHNIYGLLESNATYQALKAKKKLRPFVISRSTFTGQGHFGGHWSGDNHVTFHDLYRSVSEILSMNLFGIPMIGADICGFAGNTTYELCLRWHQLGAFYPFSRNHNDYENIPQEPFRFDAAFAKAVREVYLLRYSLLPYLYTLFYHSHINGDTVARPLFQEFPMDQNTYRIEAQFLWGSGLMIIPVLEKNQTTVKAYLPFRSLWYDFFNGQRYNGGQVVTLKAPMDKINLLVRGGSIISMQVPAQTTYESRKKDFILLGAYNNQQTGYGVLYWDDGDSLDTYARQAYSEIKFYMNKTTLFSKVISSGYQTRMALGTITLYGVSGKPTTVMINNQPQQFTYNTQLQVLNISTVNPKVNLLQQFVLQLTGLPLDPTGTVIRAPSLGSQKYPQQGQVQQGQRLLGQGQTGQQVQGQPFPQGQGQQGILGQQGQLQQGQQDQGQTSQQVQLQPGRTGHLQQGQQVQGLPRQQGIGLQGQRGQMQPGQQGQVQYGQQGQGQPFQPQPSQNRQWQSGQQGQWQPSKLGQLKSSQQGQGQPGLLPGQPQPSHQGQVIPGQQGQRQPGQQGQMIPGQQGQRQPGQQGQVQAGQVQPGQQWQQNQGQPGKQQSGQQDLKSQQVEQGQKGFQDEKVYNFDQRNKGNNVMSQQKQPGQMTGLVNKDRLSNQIPPMSSGKLSGQSAFNQQNKVNDPSGKSKVGEPFDRNQNRNVPFKNQVNPVNKAQSAIQKDYENKIQGLKPDQLPQSNQNSLDNKIPPVIIDNSIKSRKDTNQVPIQNEDALIQKVPVQSQGGLGQKVSVQKQESSIDKLKAINQDRFEKRLPLLNADGTVRKLPVQNDPNLNRSPA